MKQYASEQRRFFLHRGYIPRTPDELATSREKVVKGACRRQHKNFFWRLMEA